MRLSRQSFYRRTEQIQVKLASTVSSKMRDIKGTVAYEDPS